MKIALLAPVAERIPPTKYGGTEAVVYTLAEELHARGHDVTLFASGDSEVSCKLIPIAPKALGSNMKEATRDALDIGAIAEAVAYIQENDFDVIHNHTGWRGLLLQPLVPNVPMVTTLHYFSNEAHHRRMFMQFRRSRFISISKSQRRVAPLLRYTANIYHGLDAKRFNPSYKPGKYLAFLGRFTDVKGPVEAIQIAKATGEKLVMAGKINDDEQEFFDTMIKPHIDGKQIKYIGEVDHREKVKLLRNAKALLSPIKWSEPFGLVNVEAMLCGTPVIGKRRGSLPELIQHGTSGFVCRSLNEMIKAVGRIETIDREKCRRYAERKFSVERMIDAHERLFARLTTKRKRNGLFRRKLLGVRR